MKTKHYEIGVAKKQKSGCISLMFKSFITLILCGSWLWCCTAIYFTTQDSQFFSLIAIGLFAVILPLAFLLTKSFFRGTFICILSIVMFSFWWQSLTPTNYKDWAPDVAKISHGEITDNTLTMYNVRNFSYSAEDVITNERWDTRKYDLTKLRGMDIFLSYWASEHIAHTIMSWDFGDDGHLAISIETRKDKTQSYSAVKGFFKQFELSYVAADERDIIRLRTNYRKERVYLYPLMGSAENAKKLLMDYLQQMNKLVDQPEFYNALTKNCTTTIRLHTKAISEDQSAPIDWRIIASGHLAELLYEQKSISTSLPYDTLRQKSRVDLKMQNYDDKNFSVVMREELPE